MGRRQHPREQLCFTGQIVDGSDESLAYRGAPKSGRSFRRALLPWRAPDGLPGVGQVLGTARLRLVSLRLLGRHQQACLPHTSARLHAVGASSREMMLGPAGTGADR